MKRTLIIISILIVSALVAFLWVYIDDLLTQYNYPMPQEYQDPIEKYSEEYSVPKDLIYAVIKVESDFKSDAVSSVGAIGLMQLMPDTFFWISEKTGDNYDNEKFLFDPEINIKHGVYYLNWLYSRYNSWETALAAYNAGHGKVDTWLTEQNGELTNIPFEETREYVSKVLEAKEIYTETYSEK